MRLIELRYANNNNVVYINPVYIISIEPIKQNGQTYTEIIALTDACFCVKEDKDSILKMINGEITATPTSFSKPPKKKTYTILKSKKSSKQKKWNPQLPNSNYSNKENGKSENSTSENKNQ